MTRITGKKGARRLAASAGALVAGLAVGVPPAGAASPSAQKTPLTQTNRGCDGNVIGPVLSQAKGFAILSRPERDKVVAAVAVKGARPNTTYNIRLIQILPDDSDCHTINGTLTTDSNGHGNANVQERVLPGATTAWVDLNGQLDFDNYYDTQPVAF